MKTLPFVPCAGARALHAPTRRDFIYSLGASLGSVAFTALLAAEVNIFGSYALLNRPNDNPVLALHVEDNDCAESVLRSSGFRLLDQDDISR